RSVPRGCGRHPGAFVSWRPSAPTCACGACAACRRRGPSWRPSCPAGCGSGWFPGSSDGGYGGELGERSLELDHRGGEDRLLGPEPDTDPPRVAEEATRRHGQVEALEGELREFVALPLAREPTPR